MLSLLDNLLERLLLAGVTGLAEVVQGTPSQPLVAGQVRFDPPDERWRTYVRGTLKRNALNIYLVDLRENRKLRSNGREQRPLNGLITSEPAPARLDCHYLISAFSPTEQITPQVRPTLDEHDLLYQAAAALLAAAPLNPARIYGGVQPAAWAPFARFWQQDLPTEIAPVEGFPKLAEFWGTMGQGHRWKPTLYLVVTVPVALGRAISGPPVTTLITSHGGGDSWYQIGGTVRTTAGVPLPGAWLQIETPAGVPLGLLTANVEGRFRSHELQAGRYTLRASAVGVGSSETTVDVPSSDGSYDVRIP